MRDVRIRPGSDVVNVNGQILAARAFADRLLANEAEHGASLMLEVGGEAVLDCERAGELVADVLIPAGHVAGHDLFTLPELDGTDPSALSVAVEVPGSDSIRPSAPTPPSDTASSSDPGTSIDDPERERRELIEDIYQLGVTKPSQWHSFVQGFLRRNHVDRLANLTVEALREIYTDAAYFARSRGQR